jgi:Raf kinase inhibitor-like YbhB/YbcL family protein
MQQFAQTGTRGSKMNRGLLIVLISLIAAGCGSGTSEPQSKSSMQLQSQSFAANQAIPDRFSAYGQNISPQLTWTTPPAGTQSLVLLVEDPDAPRPQPFVHWLLYNIPVSANGIEEGRIPDGAFVGKNDAGMEGYYGPRPPSGSHHYHFKLFAVDRQLSLTQGANKEDVMKAINYHTIGEGELIGIYSR